MVENSLDFDTWKTQLNLAEGEADENDVQRLWKDCFRATTNNCIHEYEKVQFQYYILALENPYETHIDPIILLNLSNLASAPINL